jgi:hypothetical protein
MSTLDPAVRDLLVAIHEALNATEHRDYPVCAVQTAIENVVRWGDVLPGEVARYADWLVNEPQVGELADAKRVRFADRWDLDQASKEREGSA